MSTDGDFGINNEELYSIFISKSKERIKQYDGKKGIAKLLKSDLKRGLDENEDFTLRRLLYGVNRYPEAPSVSWFDLFFDAFGDVAVIILTVAAVVALCAGITEQVLHLEEGGWIEGVAIIFAVLIVASVGATNDVLKDKQFQDLRHTSEEMNEIVVIRSGQPKKIGVDELCVGDVMALTSGIQIPADGLFLQTLDHVVECNTSNEDGESVPKKKGKNDPFLASGTSIQRGSCQMLVLAVGARCGYGRLCAALIKDKKDDQTPLQEKLEEMVILIGWIGLGFALATFIVLLGYYIDESVVNIQQEMPCYNNITQFWEDVRNLNTSSDGTYIYLCPNNYTSQVLNPHPTFQASSLVTLLRAFIVGVTIVVVAVPEGLPLAVTVSLAYSVRIMLKDNNLVRHLEACETMGGVTNICSDKTGTLTQNRMSVTEGYIAGVTFNDSSHVEVMKMGLKVEGRDLDESVKKLLIGGCILNLEEGSDIKEEGGKITYDGNVTDCGLLLFSRCILPEGVHYKDILEKYISLKEYKWGFTSKKKRMSTIVKENGLSRLYCKGASEIVLSLCKYQLNPEGEKVEIDKKTRKNLLSVITTFAEKEMRVLAIAYKDFKKHPKWTSSEEGEEFETDLTLIALLGLSDPLRPEVSDAVLKCKRAGIIVRMVTGDYKLTAKAIAQSCGILTDGCVLEGPEFREMSDDQCKELLKRNSDEKLQVLARSSPEDKKRLVELLMDLDEVVSVTGDGTNDAPALRAAHVGLAMNSGTDVAKLAADIVIIDDNFASIVNAVKWGRCVFDNIRKFLQFQLTVNVVALSLAFVGAITKAGTPLTAVQLLWVNLIMDTMAALALGTEKPTESLLFRKPYGKEGKLVTPIMWRNIIGHSIYQFTWLCATLYAVGPVYHLWLPNTLSTYKVGTEAIISVPTQQYTIIFNIFVLMQLFNEINSRKVNVELNVFEGITTNFVFIGVILITSVIQVLIVEFGGYAVMTTGLTWQQWLICIAIGAGELIWGFFLRLIPVPLQEWEKTTAEVAL